jgi:signal transduction histidine kinase
MSEVKPSGQVMLPEWMAALREVVLILDSTTLIQASNPAADLLLREGSSLVGMMFSELIPDQALAVELCADLAGIAGKELEGVLELRAGDGYCFPAHVQFFREEGESSLLCLIHPELAEGDHTERVAVEALGLTQRLAGVQSELHKLSAELLEKTVLLSDEKKKMATVLASMGEGLLVIDNDGTISQINQVARNILEIGDLTVIGLRLQELEVGSKLGKVIEVFQDRLSRTETPLESELTRLEVQDKVIELSMAPICEASGNQYHDSGLVINVRDVTRQAELDRLKSELISIVSHELRSPLANVTGYIDLVLAEASSRLGPETTDFLQIAQRNAKKLVRLVDDMLDLSRLDAGKVEMHIGDVELTYLVNFIFLSFRNEVEKKNLTFEKKVVGNPHVAADVDRLQQVLDNLVSNAIKYTPDGGQIRIECEQTDGEVHIAISDTGIGIRPEDQARLFQRFFRVRSSETRKITGTGLGLSIAKSIVMALGGRLTVTSEYEKGSCFTIILPAWQGN